MNSSTARIPSGTHRSTVLRRVRATAGPLQPAGWSALARAVALAALLLAVLLLWRMMGDLPQRRVLEQASVTLLAGQSVDLGRQALAAPAADTRHLRLSRDSTGAWWLQNVSAERAAEVRMQGRDVLLRSTVLRQGQHLQLGTDAWDVEGISPALVLRHVASNQRWSYDGALLQKLGSAAAQACIGAPAASRLRHAWNSNVPAWMRWPSALQWGGDAVCHNHLPSPSLPPAALSVKKRDGDFWLQGLAEQTRRVCTQGGAGGTCAPGNILFEQAVNLKDVSMLFVGRTGFATAVKGDTLTLVPVRRAGWLAAHEEPPVLLAEVAIGASAAVPLHTTALNWRTAVADPWRWPLAVAPYLAAALAFTAAVLVAAGVHLKGTLPKATAALAFGLNVVLAFAGLWAFVWGSSTGPAWSLALASLALALTALLPLRVGWVWLSQVLVALMLTAGLALQLQLGAQSADTGGWGYFQKTAAIAAAGLFLAQALAWWLQGTAAAGRREYRVSMTGMEAALMVPALAALALLAMQSLWGAEEGVFGIQPVELAKLALVLLGAHLLALRMEWARQAGWKRWTLWLRMLMPLALFLALSATALLLLNDFSPMLLLAGWAVGMALAWAVAAGTWTAGLAALSAVALAVGGVVWVRTGGLAWLQDMGFYAERFEVWLDPMLHPHSGEQVLRALKVMSQGGLLGDPLAPAWRIPAVQYDMAPAFLAGRFGLFAAAGLLLLQLLYVASLLMLGWQALLAAGPGDHRRRWGLRLMFFSAWGAAALFVSHLVLSWGTNTGALPVMGQPMPLLAAGGSVIAMLIAPLQMLWLLQPSLVGGRSGSAAPGK